MIMEKTYIFADKLQDDEYHGSELSPQFETMLDGLEYGDVVTKEFQIWEYPSGKIFDIIPDRTTLPTDDYSSASVNTWLPKLVEKDVDQKKVMDAYDDLMSRPERISFFRRFLAKFSKK